MSIIYNEFTDNFFKNEIDTETLRIMHKQQLMNFLQSMFIYENVPESLDTNYMELYLNAHGKVIIGKVKGNDDLLCMIAQLCGDIDNYNNGTTVFGVSPVGEIRGKINDDVVLGLNNTMRLPTYDVLITGNLLADIDQSIHCCIVNSRLHPIPVATDNKSKVAIDSALKDCEVGKTTTILSDNVLGCYDNDIQTVEVLNLTEVKNSDKIQYLTHAKDDIYRNFYTRFGQAIQGTGKMAQQTEMEINGTTSVSMIVPYNMLKCRQEMVANINSIFGTNITVKFAKAWEHEFANYLREDEPIESTNKGVNENDINKDGLQADV